MKRYFLFIAIILLPISTTLACEICGCSHSNFQIGILPRFNKGFAGFRYNFSRFNSRMKDEPSEFSHDTYQTMELWGGYTVKKFQVMAFMPYVISRKEHDDGITESTGAGDLMLLVNYKIMNTAVLNRNENTTVQHELFIGGGVKLPTGLNQVDPTDPEFNIGDFNSQAGTGSVDYIVNATHNLLWNNSGIVTNAAYRINSSNHQGYKFGNRTYMSASYFYTFGKQDTKIIPNAGISFQNNTINTFNGVPVPDSNGFNLSATPGINVVRKKTGMSAMVFIPLAQNNFDGQTKLKVRIMLGVTYSF